MAKRIRSIAINTVSQSTRVYDLMNAMDSTRRGLTRLADLTLNGEETRLVGDMIALYNKLTRLDTIVEADNIIRDRAERQNVGDWVSNIVNGRYCHDDLVKAYGSKNFGPMLNRLMSSFFTNDKDPVELAGWVLSESDVDNLNATKFAEIIKNTWERHLVAIAKAAYNNHNDHTISPKLAAIKAVRNVASWDLRQSKEFVEKHLGI